MSKIAVVYWSGSGNTEAMANYILESAKNNNAEAKLFEANNFSAANIDDYDVIAFGCPAMGAEVLEETVFEPMFQECKNKLVNKKIALFGSYGWGDGEWMRSWEEECRESDIILPYESIICSGYPDEETKELCKKLGAELA